VYISVETRTKATLGHLVIASISEAIPGREGGNRFPSATLPPATLGTGVAIAHLGASVGLALPCGSTGGPAQGTPPRKRSRDPGTATPQA
jgi:hypothetical protein